MMKMLIVMEDDKILNEGRYNLLKIKAFLKNAFEKREMEMDSQGWYTGGNFTTCGSLILQLSEKAWFMENVKQWLWYDTDDESIEDLKEYYGKKHNRIEADDMEI